MSLHVSWLDVKLGLRMVAKYPGLSLVSVFGMTVAIAIGAGSFAFIQDMMDATLGLDEGDRIVSIQNVRADNPEIQDRHALHDFVMWRDELKTVQALGAFRQDSRNLVTADGTARLVRVAEITAAGLRVARVAPVKGGGLVDEDERAGAPDVIVIAYEEWQRRFDGDPDIIGRDVRIGRSVHTVVGVMPEGFRFPVHHRYWIPLRMNPSSGSGRYGHAGLDDLGSVRCHSRLAVVHDHSAGPEPVAVGDAAAEGPASGDAHATAWQRHPAPRCPRRACRGWRRPPSRRPRSCNLRTGCSRHRSWRTSRWNRRHGRRSRWRAGCRAARPAARRCHAGSRG